MKRKIQIKIFILTIFFILTSLTLSHFSPEKEIKTIQTLPRKPQATLDIEVTKVKTESLSGNINSKKKTITVDFYQLKTDKQNKKIIDESQYNLFIFDNIENLPIFTSKNGKNKDLILRSISNKLYSYTINNTLRKAIDIKYDELPKILYLGVKNKNSGSIEKIYKIDKFKNTPHILENYHSSAEIIAPVKYTGGGGTNFTGAYLINSGGIYPVGVTTTSQIVFSQW